MKDVTTILCALFVLAISLPYMFGSASLILAGLVGLSVPAAMVGGVIFVVVVIVGTIVYGVNKQKRQ